MTTSSTVEHEGRDETPADWIARVVHEALGAASVCWIGGPSGTFDEQQARQIAADLLGKIDQYARTIAPTDPTALVDAMVGIGRRSTPTVAEQIMAAGGITTRKPDPTEQAEPATADTTMRAALLADDLKRDPTRARARTNGETLATVRTALTILQQHQAAAGEQHRRINEALNALRAVTLTD